MTRKKEHKIHVATDEEVRRFGGAPPSPKPPAGSAAPSASATGREAGRADEQAVEPADTVTTQSDPAIAPSDEQQALRRELEETRDKLLRARAEAQNLLRRTAMEKSEAIRFANEAFVKALLPVVDDFERTLSAAAQTTDSPAIVEGVRLVYEKLLKILKDHHVEPVEAAGKPFDPVFHNAMMQRPTTEHAPGTVLEEMLRGYCLRDRVVRPAQVIIAAAPPTDEDPETA